MEVVTKKRFCDVCGKEIENTERNPISYPVMFETEQTEGRATTPHVSQKLLDLCNSCITAAIRIWAHGAQGHNQYRIKESTDGK